MRRPHLRELRHEAAQGVAHAVAGASKLLNLKANFETRISLDRFSRVESGRFQASNGSTGFNLFRPPHHVEKPQQRGALELFLGGAVQVEFESKLLKPGSHELIGSRVVETGRFSKLWGNWIQIVQPRLGGGVVVRVAFVVDAVGVQ